MDWISRLDAEVGRVFNVGVGVAGDIAVDKLNQQRPASSDDNTVLILGLVVVMFLVLK